MLWEIGLVWLGLRCLWLVWCRATGSVSKYLARCRAGSYVLSSLACCFAWRAEGLTCLLVTSWGLCSFLHGLLLSEACGERVSSTRPPLTPAGLRLVGSVTGFCSGTPARCSRLGLVVSLPVLCFLSAGDGRLIRLGRGERDCCARAVAAVSRWTRGGGRRVFVGLWGFAAGTGWGPGKAAKRVSCPGIPIYKGSGSGYHSARRF